MKRCSTCGEEKELAEFSPDKRATDGKQSRCRACSAAQKRGRRLECPEMFKRQYARKYANLRANPEKWAKVLEKNTKWREENPDKQREITRRDNAQSLDRKAAWRKRAYAADPLFAARKRAKATLSASMGLPESQLPSELVEAKAAQLMVRRFVIKGE